MSAMHMTSQKRQLNASRGRVTRLALFRARMRGTTQRGLKARLIGVAIGAKKHTHQRVITREELVQF